MSSISNYYYYYYMLVYISIVIIIIISFKPMIKLPGGPQNPFSSVLSLN